LTQYATVISGSIIVRHLPAAAGNGRNHGLLRELEAIMASVDRPRLVLDCFHLDRMETPALQVLIFCLENALKRNGDVRLAGVSPAARAALSSTRIDRLFQLFDSVDEAVSSFDLHMSDRASSERYWTDSRHASANAPEDSSVFSFHHAEAREIGEFHEKAG